MRLTQLRRNIKNFKLSSPASFLRAVQLPKENQYQHRNQFERKNETNILNTDCFADHIISKSSHIHVLNGFSSYSPSSRVLEAIFDHTTETSYSHKPTDYQLPKSMTHESNAFFVVDLDRVVSKFDMWQNYLPTVVPHYAVKANPNPDIVRVLAAQGSSFDCATMAEIQQVLALGVDASRIIFANPCKPMSHIAYAREHGVLRTTFDSESELLKIKIGHPLAHLVLRLWVDDRDAQCPLSNKYGATVKEAMVLLQQAKNLGLNVTGVSFHCGSGASAVTYRAAMRDARTVFKTGEDLGFKMSLLDIGGGMPGTEALDDQGSSLKTIASIINPMLKDHWQDVEVIAEPGRYFCAESQTLAVQIIGKRLRDSVRVYYVNDGLYQSFNCILYDHSVLLSEEEKMQHGDHFKSALFGQTCDGLDQISKNVVLPELKVGDWIVFPTMGAYTNGASSQFNGFMLSHSISLPPTTLSDIKMRLLNSLPK